MTATISHFQGFSRKALDSRTSADIVKSEVSQTNVSSIKNDFIVFVTYVDRLGYLYNVTSVMGKGRHRQDKIAFVGPPLILALEK